VHLEFRGPILLIEDAAEYLDLEAALAASTSVEARLRLELNERDSAGETFAFGAVTGELELPGRRSRLATHGFGRVAGLRATSGAQTMLAASFGGSRALAGRVGPGRSDAVHFDGHGAERLAGVRLAVTPDGDAYTPAAFELCAESFPPLRARPLSRMAILRSAPEGYLRVAFGVARFDWDGLEGFGLYEHALPLRPTPA
jgi:hypothetical protein